MTKIPPKSPAIIPQAPAQQSEDPAQSRRAQPSGPQQHGGMQPARDEIDRNQHPKLIPDPPAGPVIPRADPALPQIKPGMGQVPTRGRSSAKQFPDGPVIEMRPPDGDGGDDGHVPGPIIEMRPPDGDGGDDGHIPGPIIEMRPPDDGGDVPGPIIEMRPPDDGGDVRAQLLLRVQSLERGQALPQAPDVSGLQHVFLRDSRPVDGDRLDAYVDQSAATFYLEATGAGMGGPSTIGPFWYGSFELYPNAGPVIEMRPPDDGGDVPGPIIEMRPPDSDDDI